MIIGIDASNIRTGGGKKHLEKFVYETIKSDKTIEFIIVSNSLINKSFYEFKNVKCITNPLLNFSNITSFISQILCSSIYFYTNRCDYVFVPGGIFLSNFKPYFTMSQNMLPFDKVSLKRFSLLKKIKFNLIKHLQIFSFNRSNGVIFLTDYAQKKIIKYLSKNITTIVIPHGIDQKKKNFYKNDQGDFKLLYVSDFLPYKNNLNVFLSVSELINEGYDISLNLIGKKDFYQYNEIEKVFQRHPYLKKHITVNGFVDSNKMEQFYKETSLFIFASSCENLPFIVLEALSYGLPIITVNKSPMKDMVFGSEIFFDPSNVNDIKKVILNNMKSKKLNEMSLRNFELSSNYKWKTNIKDMLNFFYYNI